jgi:hypothetical protein
MMRRLVHRWLSLAVAVGERGEGQRENHDLQSPQVRCRTPHNATQLEQELGPIETPDGLQIPPNRTCTSGFGQI